MAIAATSIVSPKRAGLSAGILLSLQGPTFGIVESGAGPFIVLWGTGQRVTDVALVTLDEILEATGAIQDGFVGRRVKVTVPPGQTNWGLMTCVAAYKRGGADILLLQAESGAFLEVPPSSCVAVD